MENGVCSAVPCTSTNAPAPVITTFMSTSAVESSDVVEIEHRPPPTMPTLIAATQSRMATAAVARPTSPRDGVGQRHEGSR